MIFGSQFQYQKYRLMVVTKLEASGGITLDQARAYAETGVDYLAIGALTHSAKNFDIGLDVRSK